MRLVGPGGEQVGVVTVDRAQRLANEAGLDLVEVAPNAVPPVCKIMDFGKYKYEAAQKAKEARRNQANTVLKEVRFRLKIDTHDYTTKAKRAIGFLAQGDKVKAMILFRGREQSRPEQGVKLLQQFAGDIAEWGTVESAPRIDGRNMVMVISPLKSKSEARGGKRVRHAPREAKVKNVDVSKQAQPTTEREQPIAQFARRDTSATSTAPAKNTAQTTRGTQGVATAVKAEKPGATKPGAAKTGTKPAAKPGAKPGAKPAATKTTSVKNTAAKTATAKPGEAKGAAKSAAAKSTAVKKTKPAGPGANEKKSK